MEITSEPTDGDFYRYGETIDIALTLSAPVDVVGAKNLNANIGAGAGTWRGPVYKSGTGTNTSGIRIYRSGQGPGHRRYLRRKQLRSGRCPPRLGR